MLTPEQHELRRTGLTATDLVDIVEGRGMRVWLDKRGLMPEQTGPRLELGHRMQRAIGEWAGDLLGLDLGIEDATWAKTDGVLPGVPAVATPDFACKPRGVPHFGTSDDGVLETKWVGPAWSWAWGDGPSAEDIPAKVQIQTAWQMYVTQAPRAYVGALVGGYDMRVYGPIFPERAGPDALEPVLVDLARRWWDRHMIHNEEPPLTGGEESDIWLRSKWGARRGGDVREASPAEAALVSRFRESHARLAVAEEEHARLRALVVDAIGPDRGLKTSDGNVTVSVVPGKTSLKTVVEELGIDPKILAALMEKHRGSPSIRLNTPRSWGKDE